MMRMTTNELYNNVQIGLPK